MKAYFDDAASTYETTAGELLKAASRLVLDRLGQSKSYPPVTSASVIHDNAAGPGIFTKEVLRSLPTPTIPTIYATDYSEGMIRQLRSEGLGPCVQAQVMDSQALEFKEATFTHSYTGFAIQMMPKQEEAAKQIYRTLKPGGVAALGSWYFIGWVDMMEMARKQVDPEGAEFKGPNAGPWAGEQGKKTSMDVMVQAGFEETKVEILEYKGLIKYSEWAGEGARHFYRVVMGGISKDWTAEKKKAFDEAHEALLQEALEREKAGMEKGFEMLAWLTMASK